MPAARYGRAAGKSDKPWKDAIARAVKRAQDGTKTKWLDVLADKLVVEGAGGNILAIKEVGDRLDGKASQPVEHSGDALGGLAEAVRALAQLRAKQ